MKGRSNLFGVICLYILTCTFSLAELSEEKVFELEIFLKV
jgi:hypothetical protein